MGNEIRDESNLQAYIMRKFRLGEFALVKHISTIKVSPEIDLLDVNENQKLVTGFEFKLLRYHRGWKKVNFYPLYQGIGQALSYFNFGVDKSYLVLGLSRGIPKESLSRTMKKIDETIAVFNMLKALHVKRIDEIGGEIGELLGVASQIEDKVNMLMFGTNIPRAPFKPLEALFKPLQDIRMKSLELSKSLEKGISGIGCFGIMVWTEHDDLLLTKLKAEDTFPVSSDGDLQHKKECLLRKEFKYDKNFLTRGELR